MQFSLSTLALILASSHFASGAAITTNSSATTTLTVMRAPHWNLGGTQTEYASTTTSTSLVACGTYDAVAVQTHMFGHGPVVRFTATVVEPITTETEYACMPNATATAEQAGSVNASTVSLITPVAESATATSEALVGIRSAVFHA